MKTLIIILSLLLIGCSKEYKCESRTYSSGTLISTQHFFSDTDLSTSDCFNGVWTDGSIKKVTKCYK